MEHSLPTLSIANSLASMYTSTCMRFPSSPSPYIQESVRMAVIISAMRRELYTQPVYHVKRMKKP